VQIRPANAEWIVDVLMWACSISVERDGEARNANSCHVMTPFGRLTPCASAARPGEATAIPKLAKRGGLGASGPVRSKRLLDAREI
jgi:hypothetical protein